MSILEREKKKIIIIAPASLRKQWSMELREKFFIDSIIIDGQTFSEEKQKVTKIHLYKKIKLLLLHILLLLKKEEFIFLANYDLASIRRSS